MEQKPIKRSKHILQLSKDHHFTLLFCWKIRNGLKQGVDAERIKKYVRHFWQYDMKPHFREEEEILFAPVNDEKVQKAISDHRKIEDEIYSLMQYPGDEASEKLATLADLVDAHVRYEERELFPHLELLLTPQALQDIGEKLHQAPAFKDNYEDEFWIKQK